MFRSCNFKNREVVNVNTAEKMGVVSDVEIDSSGGSISAIIVKRRHHIPLFGGEVKIPWEKICVIGDEVILVSMIDFIEKNA